MKKKKKNPILSACMMVKDEEAMLERCLNSIKHLVDEIIIVDTGSTDGTIEIAESFNAKIYHHPWEDDFSKHRNQSISHATGDWLLVIDADEELDAAAITKKSLKQTLGKAGKNTNAFLVNILEKNSLGEIVNKVQRARFFRNHAGMLYRGIVHNTPEYTGNTNSLDLNLFHYGYGLPEEQMQERYRRTSSLLHIRVKQDPDDYHAYFYLSQLSMQMKEEEKGLEYAKKCLNIIRLKNGTEADIEFYYSIYHMIAMALISREEYHETLEIVREGLAKLPDEVDLLYDLACTGYFIDDPTMIIEGGEAFLSLAAQYKDKDMYTIARSDNCRRPVSTTASEAVFAVESWLMIAYVALNRFDDYKKKWNKNQKQFLETPELHETLLSTLEKACAWDLLEEVIFLIAETHNTYPYKTEKKLLEYQISALRKKEIYEAIEKAITRYLELITDYRETQISILAIIAESFLKKNEGKLFITISAFILNTYLQHELDSVKNTDKLALAYNLIAKQQDKTEKGMLTALSCLNIAWILTDDQRYLEYIENLKDDNHRYKEQNITSPELSPPIESDDSQRTLLSEPNLPACFRTSFTEINITPHLSAANPVFLQGMAGKERKALGISSPLKMQILLIEDKNHTKLLFVSADLFGFGNEMVKLVKDTASGWGIAPEGIILNASHTHYAPGTLSHTSRTLGPYFKAYAMEIAHIIGNSLSMLHDSLEETDIYSGRADVMIGVKVGRNIGAEPIANKGFKKIGHSRSQPDETASYDQHTPFLLLKLRKSHKRIVMINHGCQPSGLGTKNNISADFPGYFREKLIHTGSVDHAMFLQGASGDIKEASNINGRRRLSRTSQYAQENGKIMAECIESALNDDSLTPLTESAIACTRQTMYLPLKQIPDINRINELKNDTSSDPVIKEWASRLSATYPSGNYPNALALDLQVVVIGKSANFISFPAGPVSALGAKLKALTNSPEATFILGYTNGLMCYLPDDITITQEGDNAEISPYYYMIPHLLAKGTEAEVISKVKQCYSNKQSPAHKDIYGKYREAMKKTIWDFTHYTHQKHPESQLNTIFFKKKAVVAPLIHKKTPISSMGSCFARNIAIYLMQHNYTYLVTELPFLQASAHWDQVFNTACMRQIYEYTFLDHWKPMVRWWPKGDLMQDPFRRATLYNKDSCTADFEKHKRASYNALAKTDIIILTLGLIETWRDRRDKMTFYKVPSPRLYDPNIHEFHIQTTEECLADLNRIHELIGKKKPGVSFIITVSPIPLDATFRNDVDTVTANMFSKSTLRVAAEYFANSHKNVYYFPSYEIITSVMKNPWEEDNRHIKQEAIKEMMEIFRTWFMVE